MNATYININTNILNGKDNDNVYNSISKMLLLKGITFSSTHTIPGRYEAIKEILDNVSEKLVFIIGDANSARNNALKLMLAKYIRTLTYKDKTIESCLIKYSNNLGVELTNEIELESIVPVGSSIITSEYSEFSGFGIKSEDKYYIFLPNDYISFCYLSDSFEQILSTLFSGYKINVIKTFGINERDLYYLLKDQLQNKDFLIVTYANNLDTTIVIRYQSTLNDDNVMDFLSIIYTKLSKYIYTDEDLSIYNVVYGLLKLYKKKLTIIESSSLGLITNEFLKCDQNAHKVLSVSNYFSSINNINKFININDYVLSQNTLINVESAYEIAAEMLAKTKSDYIVYTCGEVNYSMSNVNTIKCLIVVGDNDGIHVYKNNFSGNRDDILNNISKSAMFYLIKKIKQNDLLNQNIN